VAQPAASLSSGFFGDWTSAMNVHKWVTGKRRGG
jgi:hypothetical protein